VGLHWPTHLWDAIFVEDLPEVPIFTSGGFPEFKRCHKGILVWQSLRKNVSVEGKGHVGFNAICYPNYIAMGSATCVAWEDVPQI
jgi:hypothetical protein